MFIPKGSTVRIYKINITGNKEIVGIYESDKDTDIYENDYLNITNPSQITKVEKSDNTFILYIIPINFRWFKQKIN